MVVGDVFALGFAGTVVAFSFLCFVLVAGLLLHFLVVFWIHRGFQPWGRHNIWVEGKGRRILM